MDTPVVWCGEKASSLEWGRTCEREMGFHFQQQQLILLCTELIKNQGQDSIYMGPWGNLLFYRCYFVILFPSRLAMSVFFSLLATENYRLNCLLFLNKLKGAPIMLHSIIFFSSPPLTVFSLLALRTSSPSSLHKALAGGRKKINLWLKSWV